MVMVSPADNTPSFGSNPNNGKSALKIINKYIYQLVMTKMKTKTNKIKKSHKQPIPIQWSYDVRRKNGRTVV
jgi:hypothetical protein